MRRLFLGAAIAMLLLPSVMKAQTGQINQTVQTVRGQVCDVASGEPMIGVTITVENGITLATVSDVDGNFVINNVPVGRHSVRATYIGYEPVLLKEQLVSTIAIVSSKSPRNFMPSIWRTRRSIIRI
jgi:hypothetical protein